jgi:cation transport ATPase
LFVNRAWGHTAVTFSSLRVSVPVLCTHTLGAVVADDVRLMEGEILLDQSMLTGESIPIATLEPTISPRSLRSN